MKRFWKRDVDDARVCELRRPVASRRAVAPFARPLVMFGVAMPVVAVATGALESAWHYVLMALGFSLIIFVHELGHFLVARWCSVKCEVFSIGIGHRVVGWKKGVGFSFGPEKTPEGKGQKTLGEIEDEKNALKELDKGGAAGLATLGDLPQTSADPGKTIIATEKGAVEIEPDTKDLTGDILGKKRAAPVAMGETDYRISLLPIGGYVKMLGQDDMDSTKVSNDPRSFNRRPIWQRMCIVSAGVVMNIIFAFVVFVIVFQHGIKFPPAVVGGVVAGSPAERAGFKVGDEILEIDGVGPATKEAFVEFTDVIISSALSRLGEEITYKVKRGDQILTLTAKAEKGGNGMLQVGLEPGVDLTLDTFDDDPESLKALKELGAPWVNLKSGERIIKMDGVAVANYGDFHRLLQETDGKAVKLTFQETDGTEREDTFTPELVQREGVALNNQPSIAGLYPRTRIGAVVPGSAAAKAGLPDKGIVLFCDSTNYPTVNQIVDTIWKGGSVDMVVEGDAKRYTIIPKTGDNHPMIGVAFGYDIEHPIIAGVDEANPKLAGIPAGSRIVSVNGAAVKDWNQVLTQARDALKEGHARNVAFAIELPGGGTKNVTIPLPAPLADADKKAADAAGGGTQDLAPEATYAQQLGEVQYALRDLPLTTLTKDQQAHSAWGACLLGFDHTRSFILQVYMTLRGAFTGTVPLNQFHGGLGIFKIGHEVQARSDGFMYLIYLLGVISVNLAVANFLPLPIVDGGLFVMLIIEKIRGQPLPLKVQEGIQVAGLVLLGGLLLFVTYNDLKLF